MISGNPCLFALAMLYPDPVVIGKWRVVGPSPLEC